MSTKASNGVSFDSPYYPYIRVMTGYNTMRGVEEIPHRILTYLLDLPDSYGYFPVDDNSRPRVRLAKYLWHDGGRPLDSDLPTPKQKLSMVFSGDNPVLNDDANKGEHQKGYRIFPQRTWGQAELDASITLKCYIGRVSTLSAFKQSIGIVFEVLVDVNLENTTKTNAYSRAYDIEQAIIESLHGVNIAGVGVVEFARPAHGDNGSYSIHDNGHHVGRIINMSVSWMEDSQ